MVQVNQAQNDKDDDDDDDGDDGKDEEGGDDGKDEEGGDDGKDGGGPQGQERIKDNANHDQKLTQSQCPSELLKYIYIFFFPFSF